MTEKIKFDKIINKIKKENLKPIPKWRCDLYDGLFWAAVGLLVIFGSLFFSFILIGLFEIPFEVFSEFHLRRYLKIFLTVFPYIWLVLFLLVGSLGLLAFQKTRYGYRYRLLVVFGVVIFSMFSLGLILKQYQISQSIKNFAEKPIPNKFRGGAFSNNCLVQEGLLGGEIIKIEESFLNLKNPLNEEWKVIFDADTIIESEEGLNLKDRILVVGKKEGGFIFKAFVIREAQRKMNKFSPHKEKLLMSHGFHHN